MQHSKDSKDSHRAGLVSPSSQILKCVPRNHWNAYSDFSWEKNMLFDREISRIRPINNAVKHSKPHIFKVVCIHNSCSTKFFVRWLRMFVHLFFTHAFAEAYSSLFVFFLLLMSENQTVHTHTCYIYFHWEFRGSVAVELWLFTFYTIGVFYVAISIDSDP